MNEVLTKVAVKCIVEQLVELEFATDNNVNPDFSMKLMEATAASLQELSNEGINQFIQILAELCQTIEGSKYQNFVMDIPEAFGLIRDDV